MLALFMRGHREEPVLIADLVKVGANVYDRDPKTGKQFRYSSFGGHFSGGMDGVANNVPHIEGWTMLEFKTLNKDKFKKYTKHAALNGGKAVEAMAPKYYAQMQVYMKWSGLKQCLFIAVNKNCDERFAEVVPYDEVAASYCFELAERIIDSSEPLAKFSDDPFNYVCNYCGAQDICQGSQTGGPPTVAAMNCRTCVHSTPMKDGEGAVWRCEKKHKELSFQEQAMGCDQHLYLPSLVPHSEPIDARDKDGYVLYQIKNKNQQFANVAAGANAPEFVPQLTSKQLKQIDPNEIKTENEEMKQQGLKL